MNLKKIKKITSAVMVALILVTATRTGVMFSIDPPIVFLQQQ